MSRESIIQMNIQRLVPFKDHPFKVVRDCQMIQLIESIETNGILTPLIVRPAEDEKYEIISGHRRRFAAEELGFHTVPVMIREIDDDEAIIAMVDANLQREVISPSEKAFAYKMKNEVLKRPKGKSGTKHTKKEEQIIRKRTVQIIGEESGDSPRQVQRYLKITELIPELLEMLDDGIISFNPAVELADLTPNEQLMVLDAMDYAQGSPSLHQAQQMKMLSKKGLLTQEIMYQIMSQVKKTDLDRVTFKTAQLHKYFPKEYSVDQMRVAILNILKEKTEEKCNKKLLEE